MMFTKTVCAKHQSWSTGAVGVHKFRTVTAFPFAIIRLALLQLPLKKISECWHHDKAVLQ